MKISIYQVDAFSSEVFSGNPAAVCPLDSWLSEKQMQQIAAENNLSETAFFVGSDDRYELRWFTPTKEIDLCGHATLATAHILFDYLHVSQDKILFSTMSGELSVMREADLLFMDFPNRPAKKCEIDQVLVDGLHAVPSCTYKARDIMAVFNSEEEVRTLKPDFNLLEQLDCTGIIVTAPGEQADFVSRFFAPRMGVPEDPVTGSSHCTLIPYWSERLGENTLRALQLSARGGELFCENHADTVRIGGHAVLYMQGSILL